MKDEMAFLIARRVFIAYVDIALDHFVAICFRYYSIFDFGCRMHVCECSISAAERPRRTE